MRYETGQRFEKRNGQEIIIVEDPDGHFMEVAEGELTTDKFETYAITTGQLDDEQGLGYIERAGSVSDERLEEVRKRAE